ncbi:MAG: hypothetical protein ACTSSP_11020 [Candidatus Asgardarchaeia archaeon]
MPKFKVVFQTEKEIEAKDFLEAYTKMLKIIAYRTEPLENFKLDLKEDKKSG